MNIPTFKATRKKKVDGEMILQGFLTVKEPLQGLYCPRCNSSDIVVKYYKDPKKCNNCNLSIISDAWLDYWDKYGDNFPSKPIGNKRFFIEDVDDNGFWSVEVDPSTIEVIL
jgi:hypothetical protein